MRTVCVLALNQVFDSALVLTRDVLAAGRGASVEAGALPTAEHLLISVDGHPIETAGGLRIPAGGDLATGDGADLVVVPGYGMEGVR